MNITILGGNGFIGSHLVDKLVQNKSYKITVFGRSKNTYCDTNSDVEYIYGDFENLTLLRKAIFGSDMVIHLLSTTVPASANMDPIYDIQSNVIGTIHLLEEMGKLGIKKFIFASSGGTVYGNPDYTPIDENHPLRPIGSYGIGKVAIESYIKIYAERYGFSYLIVRPSNPYGPRQSHKGLQGVISTFLYKILKHEPLIVWGNGTSVRDYIYIDDVVAFFLVAIENYQGGIYNLGSTRGYSVNEIINVLAECTTLTPTVEYQNYSASNVKSVVLDTTKTTKAFGWAPMISLEVGIQLYYKWLKGEL
jgi:UDP-glucose 4-epimerase